MKFPKYLYVNFSVDGDTKWFNAERASLDCIQENGPTDVALYQRISVDTMRLIPVVVRKRRKKARRGK